MFELSCFPKKFPLYAWKSSKILTPYLIHWRMLLLFEKCSSIIYSHSDTKEWIWQEIKWLRSRNGEELTSKYKSPFITYSARSKWVVDKGISPLSVIHAGFSLAFTFIVLNPLFNSQYNNFERDTVWDKLHIL